MTCSAPEAFQMFDKWYAESASLVLTLDKGGSERCQITNVIHQDQRIIVTAETWQTKFDLVGAKYEYEDSRAGVVPELVDKKWVCFLEVSFPNGRKMLIAEPRQ